MYTQENQMLDIVFSMRPLSSFTHPSFESNIVFMAKDSILIICAYTLLCYKSCTGNACIPLIPCKLGELWAFVVATIVMHQWFSLGVYCLINHGGRLNDLVQPSLQLQLWERWSNHSVLSQGLCSTGPPSTCWVPMLDDVSASFVCIVGLVISLCMGIPLGSLCAFVYFAEHHLLFWHASLVLGTWHGPF